MLLRPYFVLLLLMISNNLFSQIPFEKKIGGAKDELYPKIIRSSDNGHILFGRSTTSSFGNTDLMLIKIDSLGNTIWSEHLGTVERNLSKEIIHYGNNYLAVGWMTQGNLLDDLYFLVIDENGNVLQDKSWGLDGDDELQSVAFMGNGKFVVVGESLPIGNTNAPNIFITTMDSNLNLSRLTVYNSTTSKVPRKVIYTSDKSFIICGFLVESTRKAFVMKTDTLGNLIWGYKFGNGSDTKLWSCVETENGDIAFVGQTNGYNSLDNDVFYVRFDQNGNLISSKIIGGQEKDIAYDLKNSHDGNIVVIGETMSFGNGSNDVFLMKLDGNGNFLKGYTYGGENDELWPSFDYATKESGYTLVSETMSYESDNSDYFIVNTDENGKSCCSEKITGISVKNISISLQELGFTKSYDDFNVRIHNPVLASVDLKNENLCYDSVNIIGPDTLYCLDVAKYTVDPQLLMNLIWVVPAGAVITNNENDTTVVIDFGNESGMIYLLSGTCPGDTLDSLYVTIKDISQNLSLGDDTVICSNQPFILNAGGGYNSYLWQDGSTDSVYSVDTSGIYWVTVENECGTASDTIAVTFSESFTIDLGPDTSFCFGNSLLVSPGGGYADYLWQDGSKDTSDIISQTGTYWVRVTDSAGCSASDTVNVETFMSFGFSLGNDTTICYGDYIFLYGPDGYEAYKWQDGSSFNSFIADTSGIYWLEISDTNNCVASDSLVLTTDKVSNSFLGYDTLFCKDSSIILRTHPDFDQYFWQDGSNDSIFIAVDTGKYWVTVFDTLGCSGSDTVNLNYFSPLTLEIQSSGYLCENDSVILQAISNYKNFLWQDSSRFSTYIARYSGTYWIRVNNFCQTKSDTIIIDACSSLWIPNVFTPNNDDYNDYFYAVGKNIPKFKMEIFNRWGQVLKVLNSINEKWDGTYHGQQVAEGTYFWVADFEQVNSQGKIVHKSMRGSVTLLK